MNKNDLIEILPKLHNIDVKAFLNSLKNKDQVGLTKYQLLVKIGVEPNSNNYKKVTECIDVGFLVQVNNNPPEYIPDKEKIWNFWKMTPSGSECKVMIEDHTLVLE